MVFVFLYDQRLKSGANKKIKSFLHYVVENNLNIRFILHESALPLNSDLRISADKGVPLTHFQPEHGVSKIFQNISQQIRKSLN